MSEGSAVLALDVGGSSVKSGVVLADGNVVAGPYRTLLNSRGPADGVIGTLAAALMRLYHEASGLDIRGIGAAMPGPFDYQRGVSHMRGLGKFDLIQGVQLAVAVAAHVPELAGLQWRWLNDAQAFGLGELRYGAAVGIERTMFLTLGTGCGSAFAVGGSLVTTGDGVPLDGFVYPLKYQGKTVDQLLSARGLAKLYRSGRVTALKVGQLAAAGDAAALEALNGFGVLLAAALGPVFQAFRPEVVVLGGQVSRSLPYFGPAAEAAGAPPLVAAAAADLAALRGAAAHFLEPDAERSWVG